MHVNRHILDAIYVHSPARCSLTVIQNNICTLLQMINADILLMFLTIFIRYQSNLRQPIHC